jgi:CAAX protease family protein
MNEDQLDGESERPQEAAEERKQKFYPRYQPLPFVILSLIGIFIIYQGIGGGLTLLIFGTSIGSGAVNGMRWATLVGEVVFLLGPTLLLMKMQHGRLSEAIPWRIPKLSEVLLIMLGIFSLNEFLEGYLYFQDMIPLPERLRPLIEQARRAIEQTYGLLLQAHSRQEMIFVMIVIALTPAICEELLFRGLIQKNLSIGLSKKSGFVLTGIIFGFYHLNPFTLVPLVIIGVYLGFILYRSETILIPMIAHFFNNGISVAGEFVQQHSIPSRGLELLSGFPDSSPKTVLSTMLGSALFFAISFFVYLTVTSRLKTPDG